MSKAVMLSIRPEWCKKIMSGEKTIEVRKTYPSKCHFRWKPFKAYIYQTGGIGVVGEFFCDDYIISIPGYIERVHGYHGLLDGSCLSLEELMDYGKFHVLYGWKISGLKIYDEPKALSEFGLKRPPQSWCYVEEDDSHER